MECKNIIIRLARYAFCNAKIIPINDIQEKEYPAEEIQLPEPVKSDSLPGKLEKQNGDIMIRTNSK